MSKPIPTYLLYGETTGEEADFWLHLEDLAVRSRPSRWEIRAHRHAAFFQIFSIWAGGGEIFADGDYRSFAAPAILFVPTGAVHGFRFAHDSDGAVLTVRSDRLDAVASADRRFAAFFSRLRVIGLDGSAGDLSDAAAALARIRQEYGERQAGRMLLIGSLLADALIGLARSSAAGGIDDGMAASRDAARLEELAGLIDAYFRDHRPARFYAERLGVSAAHLNRIARAHTGGSIRSMIDRKLIAEARRELVFTRAPAKAIAFSLGFSDPAYFNRFFRRHAGLTPGAYRAAERSETSPA